MAKQDPTPTGRRLRVALLWNGTLQQEETLDVPAEVVLGEPGSKKDAKTKLFFPVPENVSVPSGIPLLVPSGSGYRLVLGDGLGGSVWLDGERHEISTLRDDVELGPDDYGVVILGTVAFFFQHVRAAGRAPLSFLSWDSGLLGSVGLSVFVHVAVLLLFFLARREMDDPGPLELPADLITKFMVTPPPEDLLEEAKTTSAETVDPGIRDREEAGGKRHKDEEGRVGRKDAPQEQTEIAAEMTGPVAAKVRNMGLLGALSGGSEGNAIAQALDVPSTSDLLSGLTSARTVLGRGAGGAGLRGVGSGGGGDGPGGLFGAGRVGTGAGAGPASGGGRGSDGLRTKRRARREVKVSLERGKPKVNGYLSAEQINRVVRANSAAIRYCYEVEVQKQPNLRGRVEINWRINLEGSVTSARVASSTLRNARVEGCMVRQIRRWRFPQPDGGEVVVTYPFIFGVKS